MANQVLYGFEGLKDLFNERVTQVDVAVITAAIDASVAEHNRQMDALLGLFARRTTQYTERFQAPGIARLQPLDEWGRPLPTKVAGYYTVAYPIQAGGAAWGTNRITQVKMTVGEVNRITAAMLDADVRWLRDHLMSGL